MFATWMEILKEIPRAILWLIDDNPTTTENLKKHAATAQIDLHRVYFTPRTAHSEYKTKLKLANIFLDTFPYNCGSTTNDVVSANVPLITRSGKSLVSRMGISILRGINNNDPILFNQSSYKAKCIELSKLLTKSHKTSTRSTKEERHIIARAIEELAHPSRKIVN